MSTSKLTQILYRRYLICTIWNKLCKGPTCFKSLENPTLLVNDVILTNSSTSIQQTVNVPLGISDFHNFISAATRTLCPSNESKLIHYRFFKDISENDYPHDLDTAPFHISQVFINVDDQLWFHKTFRSEIT